MKNNTFSQSQIQAMTDILRNESFDYQATWLRVGKLKIDRSITKSRQIGATRLFSREALLDALTTGNNQIWFAHTAEHARVALIYMDSLSARVDVRLASNGHSLQLDNGAVISFVGEENHCSALAGNVYLDEFGWFNNPLRAAKIAAGLSCHKRHSLTMFTSPSDNYDAFRVWNGSNRKRRPSLLINTGDSVFCTDGVWRQSVTLDAACQQGGNLFSPEEIKREYSDDDYRMLFGCDWSLAVAKGEVKA
ncbi:terminase family protein [Enterobacter roggenkampii]|uniref:terminase large subunit domain-containing protein n=1 Tax=Enterobacter roggenkampii TaxID=1812935 RepID=UPI002DB732E0|nr:terminase family protein [Enterobacter roggenkampii]MEB6513342.1 terminase family protein [Enterobacter roggenkampii]